MEILSWNWQPHIPLLIIVSTGFIYWRNTLDSAERKWMSKNQYLKFASLNLTIWLGPLYLVMTARSFGRILAFFAVMVALQLSYGVIQELWIDKNRPG